MSQHAFSHAVIEDGLDRANLAALRKRFLSINSSRLERMRTSLTDRQKLFLDLLPLLLHSNHIMMPGYVSRQTPCRVSNYKPSSTEIHLGRTIAKSFTLHIETGTEDSIYGIYAMGSMGTIGQSDSSDLDIWLCYKPDLNPAGKHALALKCKKIREWARDLRLEAHFFLMNNEEFKLGYAPELDEENSGTAQTFVLLDEFYRTAIYLAGRVPLWWFVPAQEEANYQNYTHTLLGKKFLDSRQVLDFGDVANVPQGEFIGAAIWQLYKAIESPYKSVLKLLLLEAYANNEGNPEPLSIAFKKRVFLGDFNIDELDSYVMIYRRIENYLLKHKQTERLELARRCFYFKVNQALGRAPHGRQKSWQRLAMERLVDEWDWSFEHICMLDNRAKWKTNKVSFERRILVDELTSSYRFLINHVKNIGAKRAISKGEIVVLGRKLQAAFERRSGKIEWINPGISHDISEETIYLSDFFDKYTKTQIWAAFSPEPGAPRKKTPIKSSSSLIELFLWTYINQIYTSHTNIDLHEVPQISQQQVTKIFSVFKTWLPLPLETLSHKKFTVSAQPESILFLINVGNPVTTENRMHEKKLFGNNDLVHSIDFVIRNNWNEIDTRRLEGNDALINAVSEYLQLCLPGTHQKPPELTIECINSLHSATVKNAVSRLLNGIVECFYSGKYPPHSRYLFSVADEWFCFQFIGLKLSIKRFQKEQRLIDHLAEDQKDSSPLIVNAEMRTKYPLLLISKFHKPKNVTVFYRKIEVGMELYILDEKCSLSYMVLRGQSDFERLVPLHRFLRSVLRRHADLNKDTVGPGVFPLAFFELHKNYEQKYSATKRKIPGDKDSPHKLDVNVIAHSNSSGKIYFDYYCDQQAFLAETFGSQLEYVVAEYIVNHRQPGAHYPVYISDLDLSQCIEVITRKNTLQIGHYIRTRDMLEVRLNQAIGVLYRA